MTKKEIAEKLFERLSPEPVTFNKLCRSTHLHPKTVKKYIEFSQYVQKEKKVDVVREGFRLLIRSI